MVDPITGLPEVDDLSQEINCSLPLRPQSPLVRGSHLDKSVERPSRRINISSVNNDCIQPPAKRSELQGFVPPAFVVVHPRERFEHIVDAIQHVIDGDGQFLPDDELLSHHPPNLEQTKFSMSKKKLKLQFIDDVLDRFEDERWLYPDLFARKRKLWHKSVDRSVKFIDKFLHKHPTLGEYIRLHNAEQRIAKTAADCSSGPKKKNRKANNNTVSDFLDTVSKLTLPAPTEKIPKKSAVMESKTLENTAAKKPTFGKKMELYGKEANGREKEEKKRDKKKTSYARGESEPASKKQKREKVDEDMEDGDVHKTHLRKKGAGEAPTLSYPDTAGPDLENNSSLKLLPKEEKTYTPDVVDDSLGKGTEVVQIMSATSRGGIEKEMRNEEDIGKKMDVYCRIGDEEEIAVSRKKSDNGERVRKLSAVTPMIPSGLDDGMETDDEEWEPTGNERELAVCDPLVVQSTPSSIVSQSHSLCSVNSSLLGSPNASFSSQSSSLIACSSISSFNAPSSILPSSLSLLSHSFATATQTQNEAEKDKSEKREKTKMATSSGPRVRPTFGKRK
ncbi:hypothetical protein PFISCL1PPCAC_15572 [Pristionchus fissidentatus]|uniref:Uncharacterized protein n=1 Tax=Pristionchus fissidentatus TaxID=1538716 RepID=A0AAV5VXK4_9BILA|nr:hypothetical protein PFISCL1PPCAC_15572 [Pristionchus fissidentatus]